MSTEPVAVQGSLLSPDNQGMENSKRKISMQGNIFEKEEDFELLKDSTFASKRFVCDSY